VVEPSAGEWEGPAGDGVGGDLVRYLEMAKRVAARLRAERAGYKGSEVNEVGPAPAEATGTSFVSFVNFAAQPRDYAHPWPDSLTGLGRLTIGPFDVWSDSRRIQRSVAAICTIGASRRGNLNEPRSLIRLASRSTRTV